VEFTKKSSRFELEVERLVLPNGLVLLLSENRSAPLVSINAFVQTGSRFESELKAGLASLTGEMLDEGTATRDGQAIATAIEAVGGRLGTFGDYQSSGVALLMLSKDTRLGLEITADLLMNAIFPEDKLHQQIERRIAQIRSRLDVPRIQASDIFNEIVFENTPQHRPSIGYEDTIARISRVDVEEFYRCHFTPRNTIISVVGDFDLKAIRDELEDLLGVWAVETRSERFEIPIPTLQTEPKEKFVAAPKEQVNVYIGHLGIERTNPDYHALVVLDTILGSSPGFTSRIPRVLRDEQGLAYSTFANITSSAGIDPGRFVAYIGTSPENLDRALVGLRGEIARIVEEPVTQEELDVAKAYLTGSFVFKFQKNSQIGEFLIDAEIYNLGFDYPQKYSEFIRTIGVEEVTRAARRYLHPDRLTTVVVGPVKPETD
jgi:zinc protease